MKVEVEKETLIRLAAIALAYDVLTPNRNSTDERYSQYLRNEISELPLSPQEFKEMVAKGLQLITDHKA